MNNLILFEDYSINEYIDRDKRTYTDWIFSKIVGEIEKLGIELRVKNSFLEQYTLIAYTEDNPNVEDLYGSIDGIVEKWRKRTLEKDGIAFGIKKVNRRDDDVDGVWFDMLAKTIKISRVKPFPVVYHQTRKENVDAILAHGLEPRDSSLWDKDEPQLTYPAAIFAINTPEFIKKTMFFKGTKAKGLVCLKIDTTGLVNRWYLDLNIAQSPKIWRKEYNANQSIMTYEPIPASAISLL